MLVSWIIFGIDSSDVVAVASTWSPTILKADCMCPTTGGGGGVTPGWGGAWGWYPGAEKAAGGAPPPEEDTEWCLWYIWYDAGWKGGCCVNRTGCAVGGAG